MVSTRILDERPMEKALQPILRSLVAVASQALFIFDATANFLHDFFSALLSTFTFGLIRKPYKVHIPGSSYKPAVVVTGANRGLGRDIALHLAENGYTVFATVRVPADGEKLKKDFAAKCQETSIFFSGAIRPVKIDLADSGTIDTAATEITKAVEKESADGMRLVALINNAGIIVVEPFEGVPPAEYDRSHKVNSLGPLILAQKLLPLLKRSEGRIINVGPIASWFLGPCFGQYSASKAALAAETFVQRIELAKFGVAVSLVEPGAFRTSAWDRGVSTLVKTVEEKESAYAGADTTGAHIQPRGLLSSGSRKVIKKVSWAMRGARMVGFPPRHVTQNIFHALTSKYPKIRYEVGWDARLFGIIVPLIGWGGLEVILTTLF